MLVVLTYSINYISLSFSLFICFSSKIDLEIEKTPLPGGKDSFFVKIISQETCRNHLEGIPRELHFKE